MKRIVDGWNNDYFFMQNWKNYHITIVGDLLQGRTFSQLEVDNIVSKVNNVLQEWKLVCQQDYLAYFYLSKQTIRLVLTT